MNDTFMFTELEEPLPASRISGPPPSSTGPPPGPPASRVKNPSVLKELGSLGIKIAVLAVITLLIFTFLYGLGYSRDQSMHPSVKDGDLVVFYRWNKDYAIGALILLDFKGERQIRRVVARAGDTVDITTDGLKINGSLQEEPDIYRKTERYEEGIDFPVTLKENEVFVLGDAREGVTDSRIYGPVNTKDTLGTVMTVIRRRNL